MIKCIKSINFACIAIGIALSIAIFSSSCVYGLQITEIMFNPQGSDTGREWIEIAMNDTDGCINLTGYKLSEEGTNHNIYAYNSTDAYDVYNYDKQCKYAIISTDISKFLQDYTYLDNTVNMSEIAIYRSSFSLNNGGEAIAIKQDNNIIDEIDYSAILGVMTVDEGYSLEYHDNYWRQSILLDGDPGDIIDDTVGQLIDNTTHHNSTDANNTVSNATNNNTDNVTEDNITGNTGNNTINTTDVNITDGNISENFTSNATINITSNATENVSINDSNDTLDDTDENNTNSTSNTTPSACHASIKILVKNDSILYDDGVQIRFYNKIDINDSSNRELNYSIEYWIEDLLGNVVKNKVVTNNQNEKTFTPNIYDKDEILFIKNVLKDIDCNITVNTSEKMLLIKNTDYVPITTSASSSSGNCPAASSTAKCEPCVCKSKTCAQDLNASTSNNSSNIKIVNVCSVSDINTTDNNSSRLSQYNITQNSREISTSAGTTNNVTINNIKNSTQNTGKATGFMVYESPNLKNRLYALIGLLLVGLTCIFIIAYKIFTRYRSMDRKE